MNQQDNQSWSQRLRDLEAKIDREVFSQTNTNNQPSSMRNLYQRLAFKFQQLPNWGKAAIGIGGVMVGFWLVGLVFRLISLALTVAVVGTVLYVGYKFFLSNSSNP